MERDTPSAPGAVPMSSSWTPQSWLGASTLESLQDVNEEVLRLLRAQSLLGSGESPLLRDISGLLLKLNGDSLRQAAAGAVLLVDVGFASGSLWSDAIQGAVNDRLPRSAPFFTVAGTEALMQLVMTQAWHLARSQPAAARLLLGLSAGNAALIGGCTLSRLTQLALGRTHWLRPRWDNRPGVWRDLLRLATDGHSGSLERMRVRSVQLLAADARQG